MLKDNKDVLHKIGEAVISEEAVDTLTNWQDHDNDNIEGRIVEMLKAVGFIARMAEQMGSQFTVEAMHHIVFLSGLAEELEVFKK